MQCLPCQVASNRFFGELGSNGGGNCKGDDLVSRYMEEYKQIKKESIKQLYMFFKDDFEFGGYDYPQEYIENGIG